MFIINRINTNNTHKAVLLYSVFEYKLMLMYFNLIKTLIILWYWMHVNDEIKYKWVQTEKFLSLIQNLFISCTTDEVDMSNYCS